MKDEVGYQTLEVIAEVDKFNQWMFDTVRPYCSGHVLEVGSGIGNISRFFIQENYSITLSDSDQSYVEHLRKEFSKNDVIVLDLVHENFYNKYQHLFQSFDTVFLLNVLEHIDNDKQAIENCERLLKPGGSLVILVPAYAFLFSQIDKDLHHYRRYTSKNISNLVAEKKFGIRKVFYFNAMGILAWTYGKVLGLHTIPAKKMRTFNRLVPLAKFIDKILFRKAGLSVIMVAQKDL